MSKTRTAKRGLALGVASLGLIALSGATAHAAAPAPSDVKPLALPTCIEAFVNKGTITQTAYVYNWCSSTYRVKVIWAWGADSECTSLRPNYVFTHKVPITPRKFDGVVAC
ncbi:hypothetical protein ACFVT5_37345 [Streptomyces sp. NPDC058001]|uniref:hypothetical protein n=1 Tax=Streptomyces sp. NPDC058001 TaxID=3346300 RepID=UPI0036E253EF